MENTDVGYLCLIGIKAGSAYMSAQLPPCSLFCPYASQVSPALCSGLLTRTLTAHHTAYGFVKPKREKALLMPPELR